MGGLLGNLSSCDLTQPQQSERLGKNERPPTYGAQSRRGPPRRANDELGGRTMRYIRFVVGVRDPDSGYRQGILQAAFELAHSGRLLANEFEQLNSVKRWLNANLRKPTRFARKRNVSHRRTRGLSWFKDSATEHLRRLRELIVILESYGVCVETIESERPGYIVYEDDCQVVAEPFSETKA